MTLIQNKTALETSPARKIVLDVIEVGLEAIQPQNALSQNVKLSGDDLSISDQTFKLSEYNRIFLLGFGKGSAGNAKYVEDLIGERLTDGFVIDTNPETFSKIKFTQGTHPLPSQENYEFTNNVITFFQQATLTEKDLVLVIICGGGSAMLVHPSQISLDQKIAVNKALLKSGATITEMNIVRKHLSSVKGGGLAQILYPSQVATLIFSDVPGNDLSVIASGPTVLDPTTKEQAIEVINKFNLQTELQFALDNLHETPKEEKYFERVQNILVLSNLSALDAMRKKAEELRITVSIYSDKFQSDSETAGKTLINQTAEGEMLLAGGETTVKVTGDGKGGRNEEVVLASLSLVGEKTIIASLASDGWDNTELAGAIGDTITVEMAKSLKLDPEEFLKNNDSYTFFQRVNDGIETGRLPSNVSDLFLVYKP